MEIALPKEKAGLDWRSALTGRAGFVCMLITTGFSYVLLALVSFSSNPIIGKTSPIQTSAMRNSTFASLMNSLGLANASATSLKILAVLAGTGIVLSYAWALYIFRRNENRKLATILGVAAGLSVLLVLMPPLVSRDIFSNIFYGKIGAVYKQNPYVITPQRFLDDPLMAFLSTNWKNTGVVYAPLYTVFSIGLVKITGSGIIANIYSFKTAMALFHLINIFLVWKLLEELAPQRQAFGTMLYAWSPLVLIETAGGGHNDIMMITFALAALWLILRKHDIPAFVLLTLSVMVKYITALFLVVFLIYLMKEKSLWRERILALIGYGIIFFFIVLVLFGPFWQGIHTLDSTRQNLALSNTYSLSWQITHVVQVIFRGIGLPAGTANSLGSTLIKGLGWLILLGSLTYFSLKVKERAEMPEAWTMVVVAYLLTAGYILPWYFVWLIPLLALRKWDWFTKTALGVSTVFIGFGCDLVP